MAIPISYNYRNMILRKGLTIMTALGIGLTVTTAVFLMMLLAGLKKAFVSSGDPLNVLVVRKGSTSELVGGFAKDKLPMLRTLPGIATDSHGQPMVSGEWVVLVALPRKNGSGNVNVTLRGMEQDGIELRAKHANGEYSFGIDGHNGKVVDMKDYGIWEPNAVKVQTVKTAIESACMLLRVDDIVSGVSKRTGGGGGGGQGMEEAAEMAER